MGLAGLFVSAARPVVTPGGVRTCDWRAGMTAGSAFMPVLVAGVVGGRDARVGRTETGHLSLGGFP